MPDQRERQPRRYSVWNPAGSLWKAFFGSMDYATTACLDPAKPEFVYAQSVRCRVDEDKGTWYPVATILHEREEAGLTLRVRVVGVVELASEVLA